MRGSIRLIGDNNAKYAFGDRNMLTKTTIVLATAVLLAVASAAQARSDRDREQRGGYHIGPLGQWFAGPAYAYPYGAYPTYGYPPGYGYAPRYRSYGYVYPPGWHYTPDYG